MRKNKRVAVITGAGRGIGRQIAIEFGKKNFDLIIVSRTKKELLRTKKLVDKNSGVEILPLDVKSCKTVEQKLGQIIRKIGNVEVLVNAAAIQGPIGSSFKNSAAEWKKTIEIDLLGTFNCMRVVLPMMIKQREGVIINFSGGGALGPRENFSAYAAAKAAVVRLTETVAKEVNDYGVRVNAISPGGVNTAMFEEMIKAGEERVGPDEWSSLMKQKQSGGNDPGKAAKLCLWLASSRSRPLTGKIISAVYDDWQGWNKKKIRKLMESDWYSMRRLDDYTINSLIRK